MSSKFTDVMLDVETLGTNAKAPIIQIGATAFDRRTRQVGGTFAANCAPDLSKYKVDFGTIEWWISQSDRARQSVFTGGVPLASALQDFLIWWLMELDADAQLWAMPPNFDATILENALDTEGKGIPWKYNKTRCLRTVIELADLERRERVVPVIPHDAGEDSKAQVLTLFKCLDRIKEPA